MPAPFEILFESDNLIAINKPPNILVHRTSISEDKQFVLQLLRDQLQQKIYPIHRLDRGTSGVLLFGKTKETASILGKKWQAKEVSKKYLALIRGYVPIQDTVNYSLASEKGKNKQEAISHYTQIGQVEMNFAIGRYPTARYSLVEVIPETGRWHQIRRHFSHLRHPVIGDKRHGDIKHNKYWKDELGISRLLLHATTLSFSINGQAIVITAPLEADFKKALHLLGFMQKF